MDCLREEFHMKGFLLIPPEVFQLDPTTVTKLKDEFAALFAGTYDTGFYPDEIHWRPGISKETATKELCNAWKASSKISSIVGSTTLGALACELMGWRASRIGQDDVIHKPSLSNAVGFHQDGAYIRDNFLPREDNCLTMWIALDDADDENGALQYAPGSHQWWLNKDTPIVDSVVASSFHVGTKDDHRTPLRAASMAHGLDVEDVEGSIETVPVQAGQMVVHHQNTWHGSGPNRSHTRQRRALVAHLINGEVQPVAT